MKILKAQIFKSYPEITFGFSTKDGLNRPAPYYFNLSFSVGDDPGIVEENRREFFSEFGLDLENVAIQRQIHSDIVTYVTKGGVIGESDAMITDKKNLGLAIGVADCTPIFIYDKKEKIIAGVHSGWRGTEKKILLKTLDKMKNNFKSFPEYLIVFMGPSICGDNYEVGKEFENYFDERYLKPSGEKYLLDVGKVNYDMLIEFGIPKKNIEVSELCTYENKNLHSYRRDGKKSGRAMGVIVMK